MTKDQVNRSFRAYVLPAISAEYGERDRVAVRCGWNDYVDELQKDGDITENQATRWTNPYDRTKP